MADKISDEPVEVTTLPGAVAIVVPHGSVAMTPRAALRSAERLIEAATRVMTGQAGERPGRW
jgi:hypothetical protein